MSVDFLSKNFPPFQVHPAKKPPRFYPDGFQRNVIDFYFIFSDCRLRKALYLQFSYFIWPLALRNINQQLKLIFGPEYGLSVSSQLGVGTEMEIQIPAVFSRRACRTGGST